MPFEMDPVDWTVDAVVQFLCHEKAGEWSDNLPCPDLVALEAGLRRDSVSGKVFIDITYEMVKDLGVTGVGHCQYVLGARNWLQRQSPKFQFGQQWPRPPPSADPAFLPSASLPSAPLPSESAAPTTGKKPRRMATTLVAEPSASCPIEGRLPQEPLAPTPAYGQDSYYDDLLKRHPPEENDDDNLIPLLGESSSESEYDTETQEEMEEVEEADNQNASEKLSLSEVDAVVDAYIVDQNAHFAMTRLPKEAHKAFAIWTAAQKHPEITGAYSKELAHLEKRLRDLRKALGVAEHTSNSSLLKACASLDQTISDICLKRWQLSVVEQTEPPQQVARLPRAPRPTKSNKKSDGEETLSSDSCSDSVHESEEEVNDEREADEASDRSEDWLDSDSASDSEENEVPPDEQKPRSRKHHRHGPFRGSSPDEDVDHLLLEDEISSLPVAKKRRFETMSPNQDDVKSPKSAQNLPFDMDVPLPSNEGGADIELEIKTPPLNPSRPKTYDSVDPAGSEHGEETDEAVDMFHDISHTTWETIEQSGDRFDLIAKAITCLQKHRAQEFYEFIIFYMTCLYREFTQDALKAMSEDKLVIEGMEPAQSHHSMLLATLFVSWVNNIRIPDNAISADQIRLASAAAIEDVDSDEFTPFLDCLVDLLEGYIKWLALPTGDISAKRKRDKNRHLRRRQKYLGTQVTLNSAQKEGKQRQEQQDEAKRVLLEARFAEGNVHPKNIMHPVSFQDPIIYLDPYIGRFIKQHQLLGIQFMFREIVENQRPEGCLLAHTMGLGKTMQVISLLVTISTAGVSHDPGVRDQIPEELRQSKTLILCPASLIENWLNEFAMWSPEYHNLGKVRSISGKTTKGPGSSRHEVIRAWKDEGGILLISYSIFRNLAGNNAFKGEDETKRLMHDTIKSWLLNTPTLVIADEAQMIRNNGSQIAATACRFRTQKRIALTGTPISNGLKDYFWMVDWVAPRYLGSFAEFNDTFIKSIESGSHTESSTLERRHALQRQELLFGIISPKVQRMDMSALATDLPPKHEFSVYFDLTDSQKAVYNLFIESVKQGKAQNVNPQLMSWLSLLQLCSNHPALFKTQLESRNTKSAPREQTSPSGDDTDTPLGLNIPTDEHIVPSSMTDLLDGLFKDVPNLQDPSLSSRVAILNEIVNHAISVDDKVLVFSSSIPTLKYLGNFMHQTQRKYCLIDGTVTSAERFEKMKMFSNDPTTHVFLISTHAGGLGLNIQAANRVVIFDFMFNPTWEEQAIGRAYRIGQEKQVFVYRMVAAGTFEERMYGKTVFKSQLARRLIDHKNVTREGSKTDDRYLVPCQVSSQQGGIDEMAMMTDPGMMEKLQSAECARYIVKIKLCSDQVDPNDNLTSAERQTVEDELQLRRLRIRDSTASTMMMPPPANLPPRPLF